MNDLISRSELIKVLKDRATNEAIMGYMTAYDVTNSIIDEVEEQPTAYDIDKVVEELESDERHTFDGCINKRYAIEIVKHGGVVTEKETIRDKAIKWNNNSSKRVPYEFIEFVEGKRDIGVTDDVCEWKKCSSGSVDFYVYSSKCFTKNLKEIGTTTNFIDDFKYCPYCGKKIKIVGD